MRGRGIRLTDIQLRKLTMRTSLLALDRHRVREQFDERFTATRMAKSYLSLYARAFATMSRLPSRSGDLKPSRETAVN